MDTITPSDSNLTPPVAPQATGVFAIIKSFLQQNKTFAIIAVTGLIAIGVMAYFAFRPLPQTPTEPKVAVAISGPATVGSGDEVVYTFKVSNGDTLATDVGGLEVVYPSGATFISSAPNPDNLSGTRFTIPALRPGADAVVIVKFRVLGSLNDERKISASFEYQFGQTTAHYAAKEEAVFRIGAAQVNLELSGPANTNNAQIIAYELRYSNTTKVPLENARLLVNYPEGFQFAAATPPPTVGSNIWNLGTLASGKEGAISIQGSLKGVAPGQSVTLTASLQTLDAKGTFYTQSTAKATTAVMSLPLVATLSLRDSQDTVVKPGDELRYTIEYQNNGTVATRGVNIVATLDPRALDLASVSAEGGQVAGNTITWNASGVRGLEVLNPSEKGSISFQVTIRDPVVKDSSKNISVVSSVKIRSDEFSTFFPGTELAVKVATVAELKTGLDFKSGKLPPKVGDTTTYQFSLNATNTTNDIGDAVLTAFIPLDPGSFDPASVSSAEKGNVTFDASTGKLTWKLGRLQAHSGSFQPARKLQFTLRFAPNASQAGREPVLVSKIQLTGNDSFTAQPVTITARDVTTRDLSGDNYYNGQVTQ